jgi:hypothetical protein
VCRLELQVPWLGRSGAVGGRNAPQLGIVLAWMEPARTPSAWIPRRPYACEISDDRLLNEYYPVTPPHPPAQPGTAGLQHFLNRPKNRQSPDTSLLLDQSPRIGRYLFQAPAVFSGASAP